MSDGLSEEELLQKGWEIISHSKGYPVKKIIRRII